MTARDTRATEPIDLGAFRTRAFLARLDALATRIMAEYPEVSRAAREWQRWQEEEAQREEGHGPVGE